MNMTERKNTCRKLDRLRNPCPNEEVEITGLCIEHLLRAKLDADRLLRLKLIEKAAV